MLSTLVKGKKTFAGHMVKSVVDKAKGLYKAEEIAYQGAFLAQARMCLLPYLQ